MPELAHAHQLAMPAAWTAPRVLQRLSEAYEIERRLPGERRFGKIASAWPGAVLHDFTDHVFWDDARERVWRSWERVKCAYPFEVSRMNEAFDWLLWVDEEERRYLTIWSKSSAYGIAVAETLRYGRHRGLRKATLYRKIRTGSDKIARRLNAQGVRVR